MEQLKHCASPQNASLVVMEFSANDLSQLSLGSPERVAFEQLLRSLLSRPSRPALLLLHHWCGQKVHLLPTTALQCKLAGALTASLAASAGATTRHDGRMGRAARSSFPTPRGS